MNGEGITDVSEFPTPPHVFEDRDGREVGIREYDGDREALVRMYEGFDPDDRAQGIPPVREDALESWLDVILDGVNAVAWDADGVSEQAQMARRQGRRTR